MLKLNFLTILASLQTEWFFRTDLRSLNFRQPIICKAMRMLKFPRRAWSDPHVDEQLESIPPGGGRGLDKMGCSTRQEPYGCASVSAVPRSQQTSDVASGSMGRHLAHRF